MAASRGGTTWSPMPGGAGEYLPGVWGTSSGDVHVVGMGGVILRGRC